MRKGLALLKSNAKARTAFCLANEAMADQRVHAIWAKQNQAKGERTDIAALWIEKNHQWRPFQLGFFLLNLLGVADDESSDRALVDLLWFPTGGGKTEAYLGLAAFTLFYRRLVGDRDGMEAGAGVSVIMRYTLRLLTVQQFQRAAALVCACEVIRRREKALGQEPYRIGLWVGDKTAPNRFQGAKKAIEDLKKRNYTDGGSPVQLLSCPAAAKRWRTIGACPMGRPTRLITTLSAFGCSARTSVARCRRRSLRVKACRSSWSMRNSTEPVPRSSSLPWTNSRA